MLDHNTIVDCANQIRPLPQSCTRLAGLVTQEVPDLKAITEIISTIPC